MREQLVQNKMFWQFNSSSEVLVPNYTPQGWWENDLFRITNGGYWHEYEIKTSVADFRNDFKKRANHRVVRITDDNKRVFSWDDKHALLAKYQSPLLYKPEEEVDHLPGKYPYRYAHAGTGKLPDGPNHFWFVIPENLRDNLEHRIPDYAGLMLVRVTHEGTKKEIVAQPKVVKKAPKLHGDKKFDDRVKLWKELGQTFYWRYWKR